MGVAVVERLEYLELMADNIQADAEALVIKIYELITVRPPTPFNKSTALQALAHCACLVITNDERADMQHKYTEIFDMLFKVSMESLRKPDTDVR